MLASCAGSGATDLLESLTTSALPSESHKSKLMYMLNKSGGVIAEVTVGHALVNVFVLFCIQTTSPEMLTFFFASF